MINIFYLSDLQQTPVASFICRLHLSPHMTCSLRRFNCSCLQKKTRTVFYRCTFSSLTTVLYVGQGIRVVFIRTHRHRVHLSPLSLPPSWKHTQLINAFHQWRDLQLCFSHRLSWNPFRICRQDKTGCVALFFFLCWGPESASVTSSALQPAGGSLL